VSEAKKNVIKRLFSDVEGKDFKKVQKMVCEMQPTAVNAIVVLATQECLRQVGLYLNKANLLPLDRDR